MVLDREDAGYLAEAARGEEEWISRFRERNKHQVWLTEYDVEAGFVGTLAAESLWSREVEATDIVSARL
jgi:hypothetical protein